MIVCLFDFMFAPMFTWWFAYLTDTPLVPWSPLTIQGASIYHLSMGAIVATTSWSKTKEKIAASQADVVEQKA